MKGNTVAPMTRWDLRFIELARFIAQWSKDPSTKVGCVIVDEAKRIVSTGFNGLPSGVADKMERLSDRATKYKMVVHAERNAIIDAKRNLAGLTVYVWPIMPCSECAAMIIQAGLNKVVAPETDDERLIESCRFDLTTEMFDEAGIDLVLVNADDMSNPPDHR